MGSFVVKTINDRLLNVDYSDIEEVKLIISNWSMIRRLSEDGDTVASAILSDIHRAIGVNIADLEDSKKIGFDKSKVNEGVLTEAQFVSLVYVLGMGYRQDEIAYVLGCTKQTVNVHIQRALKRVCRFLEGEKIQGNGKKGKKKRRRSGGQVA